MINKILTKLQTTTKLKLNLMDETQKVFEECLVICQGLRLEGSRRQRDPHQSRKSKRV